MDFFAHTENSQGDWHKLADHLGAVGDLAAKFAAQMNPDLVEPTRWAGLLHDLGKYRDEFQQYLRKERDGSAQTHHAIYGAALAFNHRNVTLAFAIAAHHAGLHDAERLRELLTDSRYDFLCLPELQRRFEAEIKLLNLDLPDPFPKEPLRCEMFTRMMFSALVDADFLDTEAHYQLQSRETLVLEPEQMLKVLLAEKNSKSSDGELNKLRNRIFQQCIDAAQNRAGFFSLTVPTGGGKTLASMAFALRHAHYHELRRIIVVIPYLSIIEQNAAQYCRIFDPDTDSKALKELNSRAHYRRAVVVEFAALIQRGVD